MLNYFFALQTKLLIHTNNMFACIFIFYFVDSSVCNDKLFVRCMQPFIHIFGVKHLLPPSQKDRNCKIVILGLGGKTKEE